MSRTEKNNHFTAILLAAGGSRRLGQPKQLIYFRNELLINYIIKQIKEGGIEDLKIILGSQCKKIKDQIKVKEIEIIENRNWEEGISSSIKTGISSVNLDTEAVVFFIVDQPYLDYRIIREILEKFRTSKANIISASVSGQLIHPVLYRKEVFPKLMELKGDVGGKAIFENEIVEIINWADERLLMDVDSIEDLEKIEG